MFDLNKYLSMYRSARMFLARWLQREQTVIHHWVSNRFFEIHFAQILICKYIVHLYLLCCHTVC